MNDTAPVRYPFGIGERVIGPGIAGEVIDRPGPYSVVVRQDRGGTLTTTTTDLQREQP